MLSGQTNRTRRVFFPSDESNSLLICPDEAEQSPELSPIPDDFSPINFHSSGQNSPFLGKRALPPESRPSPRPISPNRRVEKPPAFKLSRQITKRPKTRPVSIGRDEPCLPDGPNPCSFESTFWETETPTFPLGRDFENKSQCYLAESTAIASESRERRGTFGLDAQPAADLLQEEEELGEEFRNGEICVSRMIKMEPLFALLLVYFDQQNCNEALELIDKDYEFKILGMLFSYLKLKKQSFTNLTLKERLARLLAEQPQRPKKKQKLVQTIFAHVFKIMRQSFLFKQGIEEGRYFPVSKFFEHYFKEICIDKQKIINQFDYSLNMKNGNLPYSFIQNCFRSKKFAADFLKTMQNDYLNCYKLLRKRKMALMCLRWENIFLECPKEEQALEKIRKEINGPRFRMAWMDAELKPFFGFFAGLAKDQG